MNNMDITTGTAVAKTAVDLMKNENVLNKSVGVCWIETKSSRNVC